MKTISAIGAAILTAVTLLAVVAYKPAPDSVAYAEPATPVATTTEAHVDPYFPPAPKPNPKPQPAAGEWKRYRIEGYYRWVWFSPNDKPVQAQSKSEYTNEQIVEIYAANQDAVNKVWTELGRETSLGQATLEWLRRRPDYKPFAKSTSTVSTQNNNFRSSRKCRRGGCN